MARALSAWLLVLVGLVLFGCQEQTSDERGWKAHSASGHLVATLRPSEGGETIGEFLTWTLAIKDTQGVPLVGANIRVTGGMPGHRHGMPSTPAVTPVVGKETYIVEGLKFNMAGEWVLMLKVDHGKLRDTFEFPINIDY